MKEMTMIEAAKKVLFDNPEGMSLKQIYDAIIENEYYTFGAQKPFAVFSSKFRNYVYGLDFKSASKNKFFKMVGKVNGSTCYAILKPNENLNESYQKSDVQEQNMVETLEENYSNYNEHIKKEVVNKLLSSSPQFFEKIVLDLLLKMGYGYDENAGTITRYSKDDGIDGIIDEDKLGLGKIYIQAKRYQLNNKISRPMIDQFLGTMSKHGVSKGVFITTSDFSSAIKEEYTKSIDGKMIKLINGDELAEYLLKYEVGVICSKVYKIYELDENYF